MMRKRIGDLTLWDLFFIWVFVDLVVNIVKLFTERDPPKEYIPEKPNGPEDEKIMRLQAAKIYGETPPGGWEQYREYEPYLSDLPYPPKSERAGEPWPEWLED